MGTRALLTKCSRGAGYPIALGISLIVLAIFVLGLLSLWVANHSGDVAGWRFLIIASLLTLLVGITIACGVLSIFSSPLLKLE